MIRVLIAISTERNVDFELVYVCAGDFHVCDAGMGRMGGAVFAFTGIIQVYRHAILRDCVAFRQRRSAAKQRNRQRQQCNEYPFPFI